MTYYRVQTRSETIFFLVEDLSMQVLELIKAHSYSTTACMLRDKREYDRMHQLKCLAPLGINTTDGSNQSRTHPNRPKGTSDA